jgi:hypothetical protein
MAGSTVHPTGQRTAHAADPAIGSEAVSPRPCGDKTAFCAFGAAGLLSFVILVLSLAASPAAAQTRRALLVGVENYSDGYVQQITRTANDARDLARDLEEVGFDSKNIKVLIDANNRDTFETNFKTFLATIQPGDDVVFFYAGHAFGVETDQANYLLFTDLKSPFTYTKSQLSGQEWMNDDVVRLRISQYIDAYQTNEIANGVSVNEIARRIAERKPRTVVMFLDACHTLAAADISSPDDERRAVKRGTDSGSRLLPMRKPPPGFLVLHSASFGEEAVDSFGKTDLGRNSLFTRALRSELQRPGQSLLQLAERIKLVVRSIAQANGRQQEPTLFYNEQNGEGLAQFYFVGSIGRERFRISQDKCSGEDADWMEVRDLQKRDLYERHIRRFDLCPHGTAELARRALAELALRSDDPIEVIGVAGKSINECDRLAASPFDSERPPEVPGVSTEWLDAEAAIAACSKATADNPTVARYLFNLGRAYQKLATFPGLADDERRKDLHNARLALDEAAIRRSYRAALNELAVLDELDRKYDEAVGLFKRGAQQGDLLAMYNLAVHYRDGIGVLHDDVQALEWFAGEPVRARCAFAQTAEADALASSLVCARSEGRPIHVWQGRGWAALEKVLVCRSMRTKLALSMMLEILGTRYRISIRSLSCAGRSAAVSRTWLD